MGLLMQHVIILFTKNVNKGGDTQCHIVEHNRRNKTQSQLMIELIYPLCFNQDTYLITRHKLWFSSQLSMTNFNMQVENSEFFVHIKICRTDNLLQSLKM